MALSDSLVDQTVAARARLGKVRRVVGAATRKVVELSLSRLAQLTPRIRRLLQGGVVASLKQLSARPVTPLNDLAIRLIRAAPAKHQDLLTDRVLAHSPAEQLVHARALALNAGKNANRRTFLEAPAPPSHPILWNILGRTNRVEEMKKSYSALSKGNCVHVFIENGASLAPLIANPQLRGRRLKIHAFDDRAGEIASWDQAASVSLGSLRDKFHDLSEDSEQLRKECREFSRRFLGQLLEYGGEAASLARHSGDAFSVALEDDINHRLTLVMCYVRALQSIDPHDPIVLIPASADIFPFAIDLLARQVGTEQLLVLFGSVAPDRAAQFWMTTRQLLSNNAPTHPSSVNTPADAICSLFNRAQEQAAIGRTSAHRSTSLTLAAKVAPDLLIAFDPVSPAYVIAVENLLDEARRQSKKAVVLSLTPLPAAALEAFTGSTRDEPNATVISVEIQLPHDHAAHVTASALKPLARDTALEIWNDSQIPIDVICNAAAGFMADKLQWLYAAAAFYDVAIAQIAAPAVITTAGRSWFVRLLSNKYMRTKLAPVIDVQTLNILRQSKYIAPIANAVTVIDAAAEDIYRDFLGVDHAHIHVLGTPIDHAGHVSTSAQERTRILKSLGLQETCTRRILLASQLQPWERMEPIASGLLDYLEKRADASLIIKLHPRETDAQRANYIELIERRSLAQRVTFLRGTTATDAIKISDVCVTIYSNVGRQAAMASIPVVVSVFGEWSPPKRLDLEGLAVAAHSVSQMHTCLDSALDGRTSGTASSASEYFAKNSHLKSDQSCTDIIGVAENAAKAFRDIRATWPLTLLAETPQHLRKAKLRVKIGEHNSTKLCSLTPVPHDERTTWGDAIFLDCEFSQRTAGLFTKAALAADAIAARTTARVLETFPNQRLRKHTSALKLYFRAEVFKKITARLFIESIFESREENGEFHIIQGSPEFNATVRNAASKLANRDGKAVHLMWHDISNSRRRLSEHYPEQQSAGDDVPEFSIHGTIQSAHESNPPLGSVSRKTLVLSVAWNLNTVPATVAPLLKLYADDGFHILAHNFSHNTRAALEVALNKCGGDFTIHDRDQTLMPAGLGTELELRIAKSQRHPDLVQAATLKSLNGLTKEISGRLLNWDTACTSALAHPLSVSMACPGRQWHAEVAHTCADECSRASATVQNAFMFKGYSYAAPSGAVVTAIDTLQKKVLQDEFGVPRDRILVCGSPRFDHIAQHTDDSTAPPTPALDIPSSANVALFASQPGLEDLAIRALRALASVHSNHRELVIVLKLHPRTTQIQSDELHTALKDLDTPHTTIVAKDQPIESLIRRADVILTAYSNVGLEAAILNKPVIFTPFENTFLSLGTTEIGRASCRERV